MAFFTEDYLQFFIELAPNNNKDWFDLNRKRYENSVRKPFVKFVEHMIAQIAQSDKAFEGLEAKNCMFRINRDIRFSKDKTPYKMMMSAVVAPEGKKSKAINGVYFELGPENVRVYGGIYEIDKDDLLDVREGIAGNSKKFNELINAKDFKEVFGEVLGEKNKIIPKHLKEAAEKEPLIFNKQWYFYAEFEPEVVLQDDLDQIIMDCYLAGRPLELFFNGFIKR